MAVLISPSNNTGWGLGLKGMYGGRLIGGARTRSDAYPVRVRKHYRAPWGSVKRAMAVAIPGTRRVRRPGERLVRTLPRRRGNRNTARPPRVIALPFRPGGGGGGGRKRKSSGSSGKVKFVAVTAPPAPSRRSDRISIRNQQGLVVRYHPSLRPGRSARRRRGGRRREARVVREVTTTPIIEEVE